MRFPARTPSWVKSEFAEMQDASPGESPRLALIRRVLEADPAMAGVVWRGLEKRPLRPDCRRHKLCILAESLWRASRPRVGNALLSDTEKSVLASRLAKSANEFASAWRAVADATKLDGKLPSEIEHALDDAYAEMLSTDQVVIEWFLERSGNDTPERGIPHRMLRELDRYAAATAAGAAAWADSSTPLAKPNHANADRLWFSRVLTESLNHFFGSPMREEVAALTNIWFPDGSVTANELSETAKVATVAKLAPRRLSQIPRRKN